MTIVEHLSDDRPSPADIATFEVTIQGKLPDDYREFLLNENGGRPEPRVFHFKTRDGLGEDLAVHFFFGLHAGQLGSLKRIWIAFKSRLPIGYLPIAKDSFGNLIVLKIMGDGMGSIHFWDHEQENGDLPTLGNISFVANSFSEFIDALEPS